MKKVSMRPARNASQNEKTKLFIENAKEVHGGLYNYSKTVYVKWSDKVTIICREHGEF